MVVAGELVLAVCACELVVDYPAMGGAEATNDPAIFYCRLEESDGVLIVGGFCSSHGWGVCYQHTSANCKNKLAGHNNSATRANPLGPVKTKNQG